MGGVAGVPALGSDDPAVGSVELEPVPSSEEDWAERLNEQLIAINRTMKMYENLNNCNTFLLKGVRRIPNGGYNSHG